MIYVYAANRSKQSFTAELVLKRHRASVTLLVEVLATEIRGACGSLGVDTAVIHLVPKAASDRVPTD